MTPSTGPPASGLFSEPPPLIPFVSCVHGSIPTTQQNPLMWSVPSVKSLYTTLLVNQLSLQGSMPGVGVSGGEHHTPQLMTSRLPKLSLLTFSGDPLTWQTFWDSFYAAIHSNYSISGIQKFTYFKAQLQGDAAKTIDGLPQNYQPTIELLQDRFGQPHKLIDAHMKAFMYMASPTNSLSSLHLFYDSIESRICGLRSLGRSELTYGDLVVPVIRAKLTLEVRRNIERELSSSLWNLPDLLAALQKEIRVLESGQPVHFSKAQPLLSITGNLYRTPLLEEMAQ